MYSQGHGSMAQEVDCPGFCPSTRRLLSASGLKHFIVLATGSVEGGHLHSCVSLCRHYAWLESQLKVMSFGGTIYLSWQANMKIKGLVSLPHHEYTLEVYLAVIFFFIWLAEVFLQCIIINFYPVIPIPSFGGWCWTQWHILINSLHANIYLQVCSWEM